MNTQTTDTKANESFTPFDPATLIRISRGLADDAAVQVNPAHAEALRRVAKHVWLQGYADGYEDGWLDRADSPQDYHRNPYVKEEEA